MDKWDRRFLDAAELVASWSKDPSTKVGAVIVRPDKKISSWGFNGFPAGVSDEDKLYEDRDTKYARVIHAELNAILNANESVKGHKLYSTLFPCSNCAAAIVQSGITYVIAPPVPEEIAERWGDSFEHATTLFREGRVDWNILHD